VKRPEPFLARWSRLKRKESDAAEAPAADRSPPAPEPAALSGPVPGRPEPAAAPPDGDDPVDLAALPSIETITAGSDIRAFLRSGVPAELTKAALRRAWTSDPAIRDFIGIAENQWDFTDPGAIPGFGPLEARDEVASLLRQALGQGLPPPAAAEPRGNAAVPGGSAPSSAQVHGIPDRNATDGGDGQLVERQQNVSLAAAQHPAPPADEVRSPSRRTHGSARPK
jgi:Protein of unknown function (DUF3306)